MNTQMFNQELQKIGIEVTDDQLNKLELYYKLLIEWNSKINLTRIISKEDVYLKHFYDCLTLVKIMDLTKINTFCDIGTGAGFPGIVIKIFFPHLHVTLVDSLMKRVNFLNDVIEKLHLEKITAIHFRIEDFAHSHREKFDLVTARAVAPLNILLEYSMPLVQKDKYFLAMKANIDEELQNSLNASKILKAKLIKREEFYLPVDESKRNLLLYQKVDKTNKKYPRKPNEIKERPL